MREKCVVPTEVTIKLSDGTSETWKFREPKESHHTKKLNSYAGGKMTTKNGIWQVSLNCTLLAG